MLPPSSGPASASTAAPAGARRGEARRGPEAGRGSSGGREQRGGSAGRALSEGTRARCVGAARWRRRGRAGAEGSPPEPPPSGAVLGDRQRGSLGDSSGVGRGGSLGTGCGEWGNRLPPRSPRGWERRWLPPASQVAPPPELGRSCSARAKEHPGRVETSRFLSF